MAKIVNVDQYGGIQSQKYLNRISFLKLSKLHLAYYLPSFVDSNGRKTITQYLEEDLNERLPSKSTLNASVNQGRSRRTRGRRLSLDPTTKIRVEKLEVVRMPHFHSNKLPYLNLYK